MCIGEYIAVLFKIHFVVNFDFGKNGKRVHFIDSGFQKRSKIVQIVWTPPSSFDNFTQFDILPQIS